MEFSELNIPQKKINQFESKGINNMEDLLKFFPKKYLDFRVPQHIIMQNINQDICFVGQVESFSVIGKNKNILKAQIVNNREKLSVFWFNQFYLSEKIEYCVGKTVAVGGKLTYNINFKSFSINNPPIFSLLVDESKKIFPVYKKIPGMSDEYLKNTINDSLDLVLIEDYLPDTWLKEFNLCSYKTLFNKIHQPENEMDIESSKKRLVFDDLYYFADKLISEANETFLSSFAPKSLTVTNKILKTLPFSLTDDQKRAIKIIVETARSGKRINALLQGDVGAGKTIVAFISMIMFAENGYQAVLMAPTQVLARQHYNDLCELLNGSGLNITYLSSSLKAKEKKKALSEIANGNCNIIVGTHSVISKDVDYKNLAIAITDEEHKFGVAQRESLANKISDGVHTITMSATPIPRSLALTLYGINKQVVTISQMPCGRKPIKTIINNNNDDIIRFAVEQIKLGHQCYVVCPLISDSEKLEGVNSIEKTSEFIVDALKEYPQISVATISGKNTAEESEEIISDFTKNKIQVLISTTVIEVGVNVPNATAIIVVNAERFGLAQLHQLRGRVGRSSYQSYCVLHSQEVDNERLKIMCKTNNGFEIAEEDLKLRGTGDLIGTVQSGDNKYVKLMILNSDLYLKIKNKLINEKNK